MIPQDELITTSKQLGLPLTAQTIRNYIKSGLCHGALNTETGIQTRGILPSYPNTTLAEALTAKSMLQVSGRKLDRVEVILAKALGSYILYNGFDIQNDVNVNVLQDIADKQKAYGYELEVEKNKIIWKMHKAPTVSQILSGNLNGELKYKEYKLDEIMRLAAEWISIFVNLSNDTVIKMKLSYPHIDILLMLNTVFLEKFNIYVGCDHHGRYDFKSKNNFFITPEEKFKLFSQSFVYKKLVTENPELIDSSNAYLEETKTLPAFITFNLGCSGD